MWIEIQKTLINFHFKLHNILLDFGLQWVRMLKIKNDEERDNKLTT